MPLIKTIAEVKQFLPNFISNLSAADNLPDFSEAEDTYLLPVTGEALYADVLAKYTSGTLTTPEQALWAKMAKVACCHAFAAALATGSVTFTDNGLVKVNPNETTALTKWEFEKLQQTLTNKGYAATDALLTHLYANAGTLPLWTASPAYTRYDGLLIKTGKEFSSLYALYQPHRTFFNLHPHMADAQVFYLSESFGLQLVTYLNNATEPDFMLLKQYLKKALAYFTIKQACLHSTVKFSAEGFAIISLGDEFSKYQKTPTQPDLEMKIAAADKQGQNYLTKAIAEAVKVYSTTDVTSYKNLLTASPLAAKLTATPYSRGNDKRRGVFRT